jgi:hypothetical protein
MPVGEDDAGGEAEYESDTQKLKIEVWGATLLEGQTLEAYVETTRNGEISDLFMEPVNLDVLGSAVFIGDYSESPDASWALDIYDEFGDAEEMGAPVFSSDRDC